MKAGTIIREFQAKNGKTVTLRAPRWSDLDDMLDFINSLVEEGADIGVDTKKTREEEIDWLSELLTKVEKDRIIAVCAEVDDRFIGIMEVTPQMGRMKHVGRLGISLKDGYRDLGIGSELMREAENQAPKHGLEMISLEVYETNERARHVYKKCGYRETGMIPKGIKRDGRYIDSIIMVKFIG